MKHFFYKTLWILNSCGPRQTKLAPFAARSRRSYHRACHQVGILSLKIWGKNGNSTRKSSLTRSRSALEARDWSQYPTAIIPMLRLLAQLLWSSEIQLFNGGNIPVRGRADDIRTASPGWAAETGSGYRKIIKKSTFLRKKHQRVFSKLI